MAPRIFDGSENPQNASLEPVVKANQQTLSDFVHNQLLALSQTLKDSAGSSAKTGGKPVFVDLIDDGSIGLNRLQSFAPPKPLREASGELRNLGLPSFLDSHIRVEATPLVLVATNRLSAEMTETPDTKVPVAKEPVKPDAVTEGDGTVRQVLENGSVVRTRPDGTKLHYADAQAFKDGRANKVINANNSSIEIEWNGDKIASIKHSSGDKHFQIAENKWATDPKAARGQAGRVEIDGNTGSLARTYIDGPNKGTKEVFRTNGTIETHKADGTMVSSLTLPDGRKIELTFNKQLDAQHKSLAQPATIKTVDEKGVETLLKHSQGDQYTDNGTTVGRLVSIASDGSYEYKELDRNYSVKTDAAGRSEVATGNSGSHVVVNGQIAKYKLADGQEVDVAYAPKAPSDSAKQDERAKGKGRVAQLEDGTYERDDRGRVVSTESADGKLKRTFKYGDSRNPDKANEVTVGDTTYKYLGPITSNGQPVMKGGLEMASWSMYDSQGRLTGNWYGHRGVSTNGVYTEYNYDTNQVKSEGAGGTKLADAEVKRREESGIWFDLPGWRQDSRIGRTQTPTELKETSENRQWKRSADGSWTAGPIDATKPYKEPIAHSVILETDNVEFSKRVDLMHSASKFEATANLNDTQKRDYVENVGKRLRDLSPGFKGSIAIDPASGAFVKTASDGTRKDIREVYRIDGMRESHKVDGTMDIQIRFPDDTVREAGFKSKFQANNTLSQPDSIKVTKPDGSEYLWKHTTGDEYDFDGTKKKFTMEVAADGSYSYKNLETSYRVARDRNGRVEEETPADRSLTVSENGRIVSSKLGDHEISMSYDTKGKLAELRHLNENRIWSKDASGKWSDSAIDATKPFAHATGIELDIFTHDALGVLQKIRLVESVRQFEASKTFTDAQKKEVRKHADSLLADRPNAPMTREERAGYVDQLYWHIANPKRNEQGGNNSCNVTTLRGLNLFEGPEHVARVVAEVANTGKLKTTDGSEIKPPIDYVRPRKGSPESNFPPNDGSRSALGKLWDVASINVFFQRQTTDELGNVVPKGSLTYVEVAPTNRSDTGNRLAKTESDGTVKFLAKNKGNNRVEPYDGPRLYASRIGDIHYQITGEKLKGRFLIHNTHGVGDTNSWNAVGGDQIDSKAKLETALAKGKFPYIIQGSTAVLSQRHSQQQAVNDGKDPSTVARPTGGEHVWLVTGYDANTKTVSIDNSWTAPYDVQNSAEATANGKDLKKYITISVDDLYETMKAQSSEGETYTLTYAKFK